MSTKLFVGNLSYSIGDPELLRLFAPHGDVQSARVVQDRETGQSRGFGFVEMSNPNEARDAIAALADREYMGRRLTVSEARPQNSESKTGPARVSFLGRRRY